MKNGGKERNEKWGSGRSVKLLKKKNTPTRGVAVIAEVDRFALLRGTSPDGLSSSLEFFSAFDKVGDPTAVGRVLPAFRRSSAGQPCPCSSLCSPT
ncbi:hypothetical protein HAX54_000709 [Datura stramonium]|uniref:Uncharacterized protein n=1 Tax=Datura stramonium TaxID=4076 RepID=A0ABS8WQ80_DATST|nr:hypothetical protein [Datura stramonium]